MKQIVHLVGCGSWCGVKGLNSAFSCNSFLLDCGSELALIDPGVHESIDDLLDNIRSRGFDPAKIRKVLLTHAHWDHVDGISRLLENVDATVYGHCLTRATLAGEPGIYIPEFHMECHPAPVHEIIHDGDVISTGDQQIKVIELPGHTPDCLGFIIDLPDGGQGCFTGDVAVGDQPMEDGSMAEGVIGWIDARWQSNLSQYRASLDRLAALGLSAFYPGHGNSHSPANDVALSLRHCIWRLELFRSIPHLGTMFGITQ